MVRIRGRGTTAMSEVKGHADGDIHGCWVVVVVVGVFALSFRRMRTIFRKMITDASRQLIPKQFLQVKKTEIIFTEIIHSKNIMSA